MSYRLKAGESVAEGIRRITAEELQAAVEPLGSKDGKGRDTAIHEARKSLKKVRGTLKLVQSELGPVYRNENRRFRDLGRKLSPFRDSAAIIETFDSVVNKYKDRLQKDTLSSIRRGLEKDKWEFEHNGNINKVVASAIPSFRAAMKRAKTWPLKNDGFPAISAGLEKTYRRGRQALALAQNDPTPENYHEWRKRAKDHWYHVRVLESLWTDVMQAHEASVKNLQTWLGDDHNLVVLRDKLQKQPEWYGDAQDIELFLALADQYQKQLRENAISLGQRIYEQKPRQFTKNMARLWDAWQQQPDSMKEVQRDQRQAAKKSAKSAASAKTKASAA